MKSDSRNSKWPVTLAVGVLLFVAGIYILRANPYWKADAFSGSFNRRLYAWNGMGHVACALGILGVFGSVMFVPSRFFKSKWLYWSGVLCGMAVWFAVLGVAKTYDAQLDWNAQTGFQSFTVLSVARTPATYLWQDLVRWQIQAELRGFLRDSGRERAIGRVRVRVVRTLPIAMLDGPTTDSGTDYR